YYRLGQRAKWRRRVCLAWLLVLAVCPAGASAQGSPGPSSQDEGATRLAAAAAIQGASRSRLGVLGDAFSCPDARFVSFRRSDAEPEVTDQWYVASQLWSDALLLQAAPSEDWDPAEARCYIDKGFVFLDRLWDYTSAGYFPRANPVGTNVESKVRFTDDNLIAGLALLDTARTTTDPLAVRRYIHAAQREADFLQGSGLWDTT